MWKSQCRIRVLCCSISARYIFFVYTLQGHQDYFLEMTFRGVATLRTIRIMRAMRLEHRWTLLRFEKMQLGFTPPPRMPSWQMTGFFRDVTTEKCKNPGGDWNPGWGGEPQILRVKYPPPWKPNTKIRGLRMKTPRVDMVMCVLWFIKVWSISSGNCQIYFQFMGHSSRGRVVHIGFHLNRQQLVDHVGLKTMWISALVESMNSCELAEY